MIHYFLDFLYSNQLFSTAYNLFNYISVRSALSIISSLFITIYFGKTIISYLRKQLVKDQIRNLGLEGELDKEGTPTM